MGELIASRIGEIVSDDRFYSFDEKYKDSVKTKVGICDDLSDELVCEIQERAKAVFRVLECKGFLGWTSSILMMVRFALTRINTMPGFTEHSMYPKLIMDKGISYSELITALVMVRLNNLNNGRPLAMQKIKNCCSLTAVFVLF